ncbi:unnamed protein product [Boreogadus saida]
MLTVTQRRLGNTLARLIHAAWREHAGTRAGGEGLPSAPTPPRGAASPSGLAPHGQRARYGSFRRPPDGIPPHLFSSEMQL